MHTHFLPSSAARRAGSVIALATLCLCGAAHADSNASVQINSFTWKVSGDGTLNWTGADAYQVVSAEAKDGAGLAGYDANQAAGSHIVSSVQSASTQYAGGIAFATANRTGSATALSLDGPAVSLFSQPNMGSGSLNQSDAFTLVGADKVTFDVGYTINVSSPGGNANDNFAEGAIDFSAGSYLGSTGGTFEVEKYSFDSLTGIGTYSGVLSLTVTLAGADDIGYYSLISNAYASSPSAIPEPSEALLLLAGLGALAAQQRRRAKG
jgi:hypothetical protein